MGLRFEIRGAAASFAGALALLALVFALSYRNTLRLVEAAEWRHHTQVVIAEVRAVLADLTELQTGGRGFIITGDERFLEPYHLAYAEVPKHLQTLRSLTADNPRQRQRLDALEPLAQARLETMAGAVALRREKGFDEAAAIVRGRRGQVLMDEIRRRLAEFEREEAGLLADRERTMEARARRLNLSLLGGAIVGVGLLVVAFFALDREVRSRRLAQRALHRQTSILQSVPLSMADGVVVADEQGRFVIFNPAAERILGIGATESRPGEWSERYGVFRADVAEPFPADELPLARAIRGETVSEVEMFVRNPAIPGGVFILANAAPLRAEDSGIRGGVVVFRDVTERKRAEEAVGRARDAAEAANRELEAFSYSVSHDLRAPLRAIDGFSQALLDDYASRLDAEGQDSLQRVRVAAQRMAELIDDLLQLSQISRAELRRERVDLSVLAESVTEALREAEAGRVARFLIERGITTDGDPRLLRVALENLLGNAWKFTRGKPEARVEFGAASQNGHEVYYVRDNGAGFDMTYSGKLFRAFQRLHSARDFEGTGIGLATVARIVQRHGGRVWAEGAVGEGATFYFTLGEPHGGSGEG